MGTLRVSIRTAIATVNIKKPRLSFLQDFYAVMAVILYFFHVHHIKNILCGSKKAKRFSDTNTEEPIRQLPVISTRKGSQNWFRLTSLKIASISAVHFFFFKISFFWSRCITSALGNATGNSRLHIYGKIRYFDEWDRASQNNDFRIIISYFF